MKLSNQTVLITGGASGIGFELAKRLSAMGNTVIITGRDQTKLAKAKEKLPKIHTIVSDVSDPKAIVALSEKISREFPNMNVLINNAGIMKTVNMNETGESLEDFTQEISINLMGLVCMTKQFLPHLKTKNEAAIVNVSSGLAFTPLPTSPVYCATKAAVHSFTLSLRVQLKKTKVQVFELAPPATATELLSDFDPEDMKGISLMKVEDMVSVAIKGIEANQFEIRPGQSNQLKIMSRIAPGFILKQMSKPVDRMLASMKQ